MKVSRAAKPVAPRTKAAILSQWKAETPLAAICKKYNVSRQLVRQFAREAKFPPRVEHHEITPELTREFIQGYQRLEYSKHEMEKEFHISWYRIKSVLIANGVEIRTRRKTKK